MTEQIVHTWSCDRCGLTDIDTEPPDNWERLAGTQADTPGGDICFRCRCEYQDWWRAGGTLGRRSPPGPNNDLPADAPAVRTLNAMKASK